MTVTAGLDERVHRAALDALLTAELGDIVYSPGTVPGDPANPIELERKKPLPNIFVILGIERRYAGQGVATGLATRSAWRVSTRYVGRSVNEAAWAQYHTSVALEGAQLQVGDLTSTLVRQESAQAIAPDDGRFSGFTFWTYSL